MTLDHSTSNRHWGSEAVDPADHSLPGLKARFLIDHVPDLGKVVELGSGEGKLLRTLAARKPSLELHGCDVRAPAVPPDVYRFHDLTERVPLPDREFDAVVTFDVLEHVPDPLQTLGEARRLLKPDGRLLAFVPIEGERYSAYALLRSLFGSDLYAVTKGHVNAFTRRGINQLLEQRFEPVLTRYAYHLLGQTMDAAFFAAARFERIERFWWNENRYYNSAPTRGSVAGALNVAATIGNRLAWLESTILSRISWTAAGMLIVARPKNG